MSIDPKIVNAKIIGTSLGPLDRGILTAFLDLDYGGSQQGFGGYALDANKRKGTGRVGTANWLAGRLMSEGEEVDASDADAAKARFR